VGPPFYERPFPGSYTPLLGKEKKGNWSYEGESDKNECFFGYIALNRTKVKLENFSPAEYELTNPEGFCRKVKKNSPKIS
jgi:hypothetical protein